jgi:Protein of unknown function (DUF3302)
MLEFRLGFWDYVTFLVLFILGAAALTAAVLLLGLPGKIARARNHPDADAVNIMGWAGALAVVPWIQAFIWAFKPTTVVDIRRSSREEQEALAETAEHGAAPKTGSDRSADAGTGDRAEK